MICNLSLNVIGNPVNETDPLRFQIIKNKFS